MATLRSVFVLSESDRGAPEQVCVCVTVYTHREVSFLLIESS